MLAYFKDRYEELGGILFTFSWIIQSLTWTVGLLLLNAATQRGHKEAVHRILEWWFGAITRREDAYGVVKTWQRALELASARGDVGNVSAILNTVIQISEEETTTIGHHVSEALIAGCIRGHEAIVAELINAGADVTTISRYIKVDAVIAASAGG